MRSPGLTDEEYVLEPFLPPERSVSRHSLVNGITLSLGCWLMRSGIVTIHLGWTCFAIVARKNGRNCKRKQPLIRRSRVPQGGLWRPCSRLKRLATDGGTTSHEFSPCVARWRRSPWPPRRPCTSLHSMRFQLAADNAQAPQSRRLAI